MPSIQMKLKYSCHKHGPLEYEIAGSGLYRLLATAIKAAKMETDQPKADIDNDALNKLWEEVTEVYPDRRIPTKEEIIQDF